MEAFYLVILFSWSWTTFFKSCLSIRFSSTSPRKESILTKISLLSCRSALIILSSDCLNRLSILISVRASEACIAVSNSFFKSAFVGWFCNTSLRNPLVTTGNYFVVISFLFHRLNITNTVVCMSRELKKKDFSGLR